MKTNTLLLMSLMALTSVHGVELAPESLQAHDWFGWSMDVDGSYMAVGAPYDNQGASNSGAVYIYERTKSGWQQAAGLKAAQPQAGAQFGYSVAIRGDLLIVGANLEDHEHTDWRQVRRDAGAVYIFNRTGREWKQTARIVSSKAKDMDQFGFTVDIQNETAVVGVPIYCETSDWGDQVHGAVCIFQRVDGKWQESDFVQLAREKKQGDQFGRTVAIHGDTLFVTGHDDFVGVIHVYEKIQNKWTYRYKLRPQELTNQCNFGTSLAVCSDMLVANAWLDDQKGLDAGCVFVFEFKKDEKNPDDPNSRGMWKQTEILTAGDAKAGDAFGKSVALAGGTILVGAPYADIEQSDSAGAVYVFEKKDGGFKQVRKIVESKPQRGARLGSSVCVSGSDYLSGAMHSDARGCNSGKVLAVESAGACVIEPK